ncbi:glycosyltransferase family 2 protein [Flavobacterium artemisiae]|uniref:Glycosyltransferase family 2 protein n=1 Tax=Flavobacterium artemisiae TaxID=2126556 RepID=A0ABW4H8X1_9FLAO
MDDNPKISIVTVVFNGASTLESTILSVINQNYKNIEFIIIDGGSTDGTLDLIKKYEDKISFWHSEPDKGIYDAMNKGLLKANGEWLMFLGCDDLLLNTIHEIEPLMKDKSSVYYGNSFFNKELLIYDGKFNGFKLSKKNICHQAIFYPKMIYKKREYDLKYKLLADYNYNIICYGDSRLNFEYMPFLISVFNQYGSVNQSIDKVFMDDKYKIVSLHLSKTYAAYIKIYDLLKATVKKIIYDK